MEGRREDNKEGRSKRAAIIAEIGVCLGDYLERRR